MKIVTVAEMRRIEEEADAAGHSFADMMEMAGRATGNIAHALMIPNPEQTALILVGPGNNGGDGLVVAQALLELGHPVSVYIWKRTTKGDNNLRKLRRRRRDITILWAENDPDWSKLRAELEQADLIVDALLGTGAARPIEGRLGELLAEVRRVVHARRNVIVPEPPIPMGLPRFPLMEALALGMAPPDQPAPTVDEDWDEDEDWYDDDEEDETDAGAPNEDEGHAADEDDEWDDELDALDAASGTAPPWPRPPILAVDCPSGLNCDTGEVDPAALRAEMTITFGFPKWGHCQFPGVSACGVLAVCDIGLAPNVADGVKVELVGPKDVQGLLPARPADAHKGTFGKALIAAGSLNYTGAAYLSASAALRTGVGLATLAIPAPLHAALAGNLPEVTWLPLPGPDGCHTAPGAARLLNAVAAYDALLIGPGLTTEEDARAFIAALFAAGGGLDAARWRGRCVADADALNLLADLPAWPARLPPESILTPHPGEMARLLGVTTDQVNNARIATAQRSAQAWGHIVVLKGAHTVIAGPDGRTAVLPFALPSLATAGSGDVLAGAIVALLAQGMPPYEAAICGAYLHGHAGLLVARNIGLSGGVARDIMERLPEALRQLANQ